jgi:Xaa-Pro aminopeptidase
VLHDISFDTISGSGPHGAVVHYRVNYDTNRKLDSDSVLLVDSGAQYHDGTTDITRTLPLGKPSHEMVQAFTRVLQGMIAISQVRFPKGLTGRDLDALARAPLWAAGQDYDHGTGHGVGSFLSVHEGPQRISRATDVVLEPGMILSNEPGYYRAGAFGIRIENLILVQPAPDLPGGDNRIMLEFETITYAPIDLRLIDANMLTRKEKNWLNAYHQAVYSKLSPILAGPIIHWLAQATAEI